MWAMLPYGFCQRLLLAVGKYYYMVISAFYWRAAWCFLNKHQSRSPIIKCISIASLIQLKLLTGGERGECDIHSVEYSNNLEPYGMYGGTRTIGSFNTVGLLSSSWVLHILRYAFVQFVQLLWCRVYFPKVGHTLRLTFCCKVAG